MSEAGTARAAGRDRPREKLSRLGAPALGDNELLALVLGYGSSGTSALGLANLVLQASGGVHGLPGCTAEELRRVPGFGQARAAQVLASVELGRRTLLRQPADRPRLRTPGEVATYLLPEFGARPVEQFGVVLLDAKHRLLKTVLLTVGTLDRSVVHPREVFREAVSSRAAGIVLFHNHPSGDPEPSADDLALTRRMVAAGELMGIDVLDHVVLTATRYASVRELGYLR
ncbi:MAG TPA: DNA repair protein RadC [Vicinamibacterales bacterium]|nr:DNA repair protein RadC [Vicinamibacterales bacterium]HPW21433.1 DNA repair protein RadC [Vicinamibacterales bacterium]